MNLLRVSFIGLLAIGSTACTYTGATPGEKNSSSEAMTAAPDDTVSPATATSGTAIRANDAGRIESWEAFIALQAPMDQQYLQELDYRYFGVMSFNSPEERDYLLQAGFPTPEEWLAATKMTDSDLQARADGGDMKAAGMFADRMSRRLEKLIEMAELEPGSVKDSERAAVSTAAVVYAMQARQSSRSPFGLYVDGMVMSSILDSWEPMTAAMLESRRRGDPRVQRLIDELHARHPVQNIGAIYVSLEGMANDRR